MPGAPLNSRLVTLLLASIAICFPAEAGLIRNLLVPIAADSAPGAFGSSWSTELRIYNSSAFPRLLLDACFSRFCFPSGTELPPHSESIVEMNPLGGNGGPEVFRADEDWMGDLTFQLRVFDHSRTTLNWGTTLPVVDWSSESAEEFWFVRVPVAPPFRHTLRIYSMPIILQARPVTVRFYDADSSALVATRRVDVGDTYVDVAQLGSAGIPELQGIANVRVQVVSETGEPVWAMVSVTNDETQVVTIIPGGRP
jgi:hypothetical protein